MISYTMSLIDVLGKLFGVFSTNESTAWNNNFYRNILPLINKEYNLIKNEDGTKFAKYIKDMKESVISGNKTMNQLLPKVFALVKKSMGITLKMEHFDVQLLGAAVLHAGKIAEMKTGEGKTYITPLAAVLNCLNGEKVIIMTSNDYLAKRDANILRPLYELLGISVGFITDNMSSADKHENYKCDIIHVSNSGVVFDYLRDRLISNSSDRMQPAYSFCIVDEVDGCLIDGSRTPLIISGTSKEKTANLYSSIASIIKNLDSNYYKIVSEKAILTNDGLLFVEKELAKINIHINIYEKANIGIFNIITNLLHARVMLKKGKDYIVSINDEILLIDQHTHRTSDGRRFSHGLHQAIEALEDVEIKDDNIISASTTYFTYATLFKKIGGMSGTCMQERNEFIDLYNLDIVQIPTNKPLIRKDHPYVWLFKNKDVMYNYVVDIIRNRKENRPILICTPSVYESEMLHDILNINDISHELLNAKHPNAEVAIIEKAGLPGAITLTTGMAGRGTDILLGGSVSAELKKYTEQIELGIKTEEEIRLEISERKKKVIEDGGLLVLVVGLFESKKTEDQIRGRSGRQGEPGETMVFCSRDDDLVKMALPQEGGGIVESLANSINFIDDKDILSDKDITDTIREIQYVYQANDAEVRKNQSKLSNNAQSISIPGHAGNYHYRDLILDCQDLKKFHFNLIDKIVKQIKYRDISEFIINIGDLVFKDKPNPFIECKSIDDVYSNINTTLDELYQKLNTNLILYTYDKCYEKFMLSEDGARRTVNTIVYGQMDPATEFERIIYDLLKDTMKKFANDCLLYAYYTPDASTLNSSRSCSGPTCDLPDLEDIKNMFAEESDEQEAKFDSLNIFESWSDNITYSDYLKNTDKIIDIYTYFIDLFINKFESNLDIIKQEVIKMIVEATHNDIQNDDELNHVVNIEELRNLMVEKINIITSVELNDNNNILYNIFLYSYEKDNNIDGESIESLDDFIKTTNNNIEKLEIFINHLIILLFIFNK